MSKKKKAWAEDVFESWGGYMAAKKAKLEEQFVEDAKAEYQDTSSLFQGVAIFVNGYTNPTADELRRLMMEHGGIYHHYLRPQQTTHMIASNLPYSKIVMYMKSKNPLPLCKPSWITDSIKAGKVIDFRKYLLYSQCTKAQPQLLNVFKSVNPNSPTFNDSKSSKTNALQRNESKSPKVSEKECEVSKSPAVPSTSKIIFTPRSNSQNKFPTEEEFVNNSNVQSSRSSTPKASPNNLDLQPSRSSTPKVSSNDSNLQSSRSSTPKVSSNNLNLQSSRSSTPKVSPNNSNLQPSRSSTLKVSSNNSNLQSSRTSTPRKSSKNPLRIISMKLDSPKLDSLKSDLSTSKKQIHENSKSVEISSSDQNTTEVSNPSINNATNKSEGSDRTEVEESIKNTESSSTLEVSSKDPSRIFSIKPDSPKLDSPKSESLTTENQIQENPKSVEISSSDQNTTEVSKPPTNDVKKTTEESLKTQVKDSPPKNTKSSYSNCSKNSDFISEFYNNSRLHHIATMGATFKDYINELRDKSNGKFPGLERLILKNKFNRPGPSTKTDSDSEDDIFAVDSSPNENLQENVIMHIDMDCFFVSVGIRNHPELKGLPVAVTHAKGNNPSTSADGKQGGSYSEIASCSYEARKFGLKNGMFLGQAQKLCPNLKTIKYDFEGYKEVSYALYDTVASYTLDIEAVSCDEMYADLSKILSETGLTPLEFADILREEIKRKTGCPVSTGFGGNKLQARLATKKAKPDGKFHLKEEAVLDYIGTLNAKDLPGVGYSTTSKLNAMNVKTCADLQTLGLSALQKEFGKKTGELLYNMCRGIDNSKLSVEHVRKSISAEVNYGIRFENNADAEEFLKKLSVEICTRLRKANAKGRCITLKLMVRARKAPKETAKFMGHGLCDYFTKSTNFIAFVDELSLITKEILMLWNQMQQVPEDIRGIGIQMSRLEILKHKSNTNLMNFINKAKQTKPEPKAENSTNIPKPILDQKNDDLKFESTEKKRNLEITSKLMPKISNFQHGAMSAFLSKDKFILPSQDIDDSILAELPEDIRREILSSKSHKSKRDPPKKKGSQGTVKTIQTKQEAYFREKKPNIAKGKAKLPPMEDVDMAVLVELPEDIRNEILNEYKTNQNSDSSSFSTKPDESELDRKEKSNSPEIDSNEGSTMNLIKLNDEKNFSFSQVDPEFLAALPKDMRDDVQMYCMIKKRERNNAEKKAIDTRANGISDNWSMFKQSKNSKNCKPKSTRGRKPKNLGRSDAVATRLKQIEQKSEKSKLEIIKKVDREEEAKAIKEKADEKEMLEIISHMRSFSVEDLKSNGQEKALSILVKCMFGLPVDQVRMQIQNWVSNSETVNEIDILSLATYLSMLPKKRLIEDLHVLLKCMHRCITKSGSCVWHKTYRKIVEHVQHYMQIEYNSDLMVPSIGCSLHKCKGDDVL